MKARINLIYNYVAMETASKCQCGMIEGTVAELLDDRTPSASIHHRKSAHVGRFSPELGKLANVNVGLRGQRVSDAFINVAFEKFRKIAVGSGGGVVGMLSAYGARGFARFQRFVISCFQVAIWLKYC